MADSKKISDLTPVVGLEDTDEFLVIDKQGFTDTKDSGGGGKTSKITLDNLRNAILGGSSGGMGKDIVFADDGGNVGIGPFTTFSPAYKLDVQGDEAAIRIGSDDNPDMVFLGRRGSYGDNLDKGYIRLRDDSAVAGEMNKVVLDTAGDSWFTGGKVGIGTSSPSATLEVQATDDSAGAYAFWVVSKDHSNSIITAYENGDVQLGDFFYEDSSSSIGIGATTNGNNKAIRLQPESAVNAYSKIFADSTQNFSLGSASGAEPRIYLRGTDTGDTFAGDIYMASALAANCLVIQGTTGNVGIGTNSARHALHVVSSQQGQVCFEGTENGYTSGSVLLYNSSTNTASARGNGTFMHDKENKKEWFVGRPYGGNDKLVFSRRTDVDDSEWRLKTDHSVRKTQAEYDALSSDADRLTYEPADRESGTKTAMMEGYTGSGGDGGVKNLMVIDDAGNVGIGTNDPSQKLEIWGENASSCLGIYNKVDKDLKMGSAVYDNGGTLSLFNDGVVKVHIDGRHGTPNDTFFNAGNVGIGVSEPHAQLSFGMSLNGKLGNVGVPGGGHGILYHHSGGILHGMDIDGYSSNHYFPAGGSNEVSQFRIGSMNTGDGHSFTPHLIVDQQGDVGIGTTSPATALDINKEIGEASPIITLSRGGVSKSRFAIANATSSILDGSVTDDLCIRTEGGNIRFGTESATKTDMSILSNGNVGIGGANPSSSESPRLHVISEWPESTHDTGGLLEGENQTLARFQQAYNHTDNDRANGEYLDISIRGKENGHYKGMHISSGYANLSFGARNVDDTYGGKEEHLVINQHGKVGIGTDDPKCALAVKSEKTPDWEHTSAIVSQGLEIRGHGDVLLDLNSHHATNATNWRLMNRTSGSSANAPAGSLLFQNTLGQGTGSAGGTIMWLTPSGDVHGTGVAFSMAFDARDLDNVRDTEVVGLEKINNLNVRDFESKGETKTGIVAQELKEVVASAVSGDENDTEIVMNSVTSSGVTLSPDGRNAYATEKSADEEVHVPLGIAHSELIPMLVKAVQELSDQNLLLHQRMNRLSNGSDPSGD